MSKKIDLDQRRIQGILWSLNRSGNTLRADIYTLKHARCYRVTDMTDILNGNIRIGDDIVKKRVDEKYRLITTRTRASSKEPIPVPNDCPKCNGRLMKIIRSRFEKLHDQERSEIIYLCNNYTECVDVQLSMWLRMECKSGLKLPVTNIELKRKLLMEPMIKTPLDLYRLISSHGHITWKTINQYTQKEKDFLKYLTSKLPRHVSMMQLLFVVGYPVSSSKTRKITEYYQTLTDIKQLTREKLVHIAQVEKLHFSSSEIDACLKFVKLPIFLTTTVYSNTFIDVISSAKMKQLIRLTKHTSILLHGSARDTKEYGHYHRKLINSGCVFVKEVKDAKLIFTDSTSSMKQLQMHHPNKIVLNINYMEVLRETPHSLY